MRSSQWGNVASVWLTMAGAYIALYSSLWLAGNEWANRFSVDPSILGLDRAAIVAEQPIAMVLVLAWGLAGYTRSARLTGGCVAVLVAFALIGYAWTARQAERAVRGNAVPLSMLNVTQVHAMPVTAKFTDDVDGLDGRRLLSLGGSGGIRVLFDPQTRQTFLVPVDAITSWTVTT